MRMNYRQSYAGKCSRVLVVSVGSGSSGMTVWSKNSGLFANSSMTALRERYSDMLV